MTSDHSPSTDGSHAQLASLGWDEQLARDFESLRAPGTIPARVIAEHRDRYIVRAAEGERAAVLAGRLRHHASSREDLPATGDWVVVDEGDGTAAIHAVLPRRSIFRRKAAGETTEAQVLAANVDVALIAAALPGDVNARRIERYLALAWESGRHSRHRAHQGGPGG